MKFWDNKRKTRRAIWKRKGGLRKLFFPDGGGTFYGFETIAVFRGMCADRIVQWCYESSVFYTAECEQGDKISGGYSGNAAFWEASQRNPSDCSGTEGLSLCMQDHEWNRCTWEHGIQEVIDS